MEKRQLFGTKTQSVDTPRGFLLLRAQTLRQASPVMPGARGGCAWAALFGSAASAMRGEAVPIPAVGLSASWRGNPLIPTLEAENPIPVPAGYGSVLAATVPAYLHPAA